MHLTAQELLTCLITLIVPCVTWADHRESVLTVTLDGNPIQFDMAALKAFDSCFWNVTSVECSANITDNEWVNSNVKSAGTANNQPVQRFHCYAIRTNSVTCERLEKYMATPCPGCDAYFSIRYNLSSKDNCTKIIWSSYSNITLEVSKEDYFCNFTIYNTSEPTPYKSERTTTATKTFSSTSALQESNTSMPLQGLTKVINATTASTIESTMGTVKNLTQLTSDDDDSDKILIIILATIGGFLLLVIVAIILCIVCKSKNSRSKKHTHGQNEIHMTSREIPNSYSAHGNSAGASNQNGFRCDNENEIGQSNVYDEAFEDHTDPTGFVSITPTAGNSPMNNPGSDKSLSIEDDSGYSSIGDIFPHLQNIQREHQTDALVNVDDRERINCDSQLSDVEYAVVDNGQATYSRLGKSTKNFTSPYSDLLNPNIGRKSRHPVPLSRTQKESNNDPAIRNFPDNQTSLSNEHNVTTDKHVRPSEYATADEISGFDGAGMNNPFTYKEATEQPSANADLEPIYAVVNKTKRKSPEKENSQDIEGLKEEGNPYPGLEDQGKQPDYDDMSRNSDLSRNRYVDNDKSGNSEDNSRVYYEIDRDNEFWINSGGLSGFVQNIESEI